MSYRDNDFYGNGYGDVYGTAANYRCDLCGENHLKDVFTAEGQVCLCERCSRQIDMMGAGMMRDSVLRFSMGNVC